MKIAHRTWWGCVLPLFCASVLGAKDLGAYQVGDAADADIVTPVALDVVDSAAAAGLKPAEAAKTPAIFRSCPDTTNALVVEFLAGFAGARSNFTAAVQDTFHQATLDEKTIASPDFGYFITSFNIKNKQFPVTADLAAPWARGEPGLQGQHRLLYFLLLTMQRPVRPDGLPEGFVASETLRLVPVRNPNETLTLPDAVARGKLVMASSVMTLSQLRATFRREFTGDDEQPLARALTTLLRPNCIPDPALTQLARDQAARQLAVIDHYDAGQLIIRQGAVIDVRIKSALDQLNEALAGSAGQPPAAGHNDIQPTVASVSPVPDNAPPMPDQAVPATSRALETFARNHQPVILQAVVSLAALAGLGWWISRRRRDGTTQVQVITLPPQDRVMLRAEFTQVIVETLVKELGVHRRELQVAQQIAASEIGALARRLDDLQLTMQEREQAYQTQIRKLEAELAVRTEENRELLKVKIEMIHQQLEVERTRNRAGFN